MMKRKIFISFAILLVLSLFASAKVIEVPDAAAFMFISGKPPAAGSSACIDEFGVTGATYYAVAESGYSYSSEQTTNYSTRKYNTLSAAEAALPASLSAPAVINILGTWSSADTAAVTVDGVTTSAANYILIRTIDESRHNGSYDTNAYRLEPIHNTGIKVLEEYVRIDGLQIKLDLNYGSNKSGILLNPAGTTAELWVSNCIIFEVSGESYVEGDGINLGYTSGANSFIAKIWNNLIYDLDNSSATGITDGAESDWTAYIYNNTIINCGTGILRDGATMVAKNNLVANCTTNYSGTFDASSDYNASSDATDTGGTNDRTSQTFTFVNSGSKDFHITSNDTGARDHGTDLSSDSDLAFSNDIDCESRPYNSTWDIGADEYTP